MERFLVVHTVIFEYDMKLTRQNDRIIIAVLTERNVNVK